MKPGDWRDNPEIMRARRTRDVQTEAAAQPRQRPRKAPLLQSFAVWPLLDRFDKQPLWHRRGILAAMIVLILVVDFMTGYEISVASLYIIPVFLAAWTLGMAYGLGLALVASSSIILSNWAAGQFYSESWILIWNILVRGGTFATLAVLATSLRQQMERVHRLSLSDSLTNAWNRRAFYQAFSIELARVARNPVPISLAYIDVDDFKTINDSLGHSAGDEVLKAVASACLRSLRLQDTVARMGGDEFAILMPDTDEVALAALLDRVSTALKDGTQAIAPVTFSIGGVSFMETPASVNSALHLADELMYRVKATGKDRILCGRYPSRDGDV